MDAWYSFYREPLEPGAPNDIELIVTFVEPPFACLPATRPDLDALSFVFLARLNGIQAAAVFSRSGPALGPTSGGSGYCELDTVDDRFREVADGGVIVVGEGGSLTGIVEFTTGAYTVAGSFTARHCPVLDFAASP